MGGLNGFEWHRGKRHGASPCCHCGTISNSGLHTEHCPAHALRVWRVLNQVGQIAAAKLIGVSQPMVSQVESGGRPVVPDVAAAIERHCGIKRTAWNAWLRSAGVVQRTPRKRALRRAVADANGAQKRLTALRAEQGKVAR